MTEEDFTLVVIGALVIVGMCTAGLVLAVAVGLAYSMGFI